MSLLSTAQNEVAFRIASNLDTSPTELTRYAGSTAVANAFGTLTQSSDSLTGNASYIFGSNGRVQYSQIGTNGGINDFVQEFVFKKSTKPTSGNVHILAAIPTSIAGGYVNQVYIDSNGYLIAYIRGTYTTTSLGNSTNICDDKWHHVVVSYQSVTNGFRIYIDGTLVNYGNTIGNSSWYGIWNLGSYLDQDLTTANYYFDGKIDFAAFYNGSISNTGMDNFVVNHRAEFANKVVSATALTASGLAAQPAITTVRSANYSATPATASATSPNAIQSARNNFTLLNTYLGTLSLEQWYKFDDTKNIINYGSGGPAAFYFTGNATSEDHSGIQGSGALKICGNDNDGGAYITLDDFTTMTPELTDGDFSVGFWVKAPSAVASNPAVVWNASNYNDGKFTGFIIHNSGKLEFQMYTNSMHSIQTASSICDNNWHLVVGKYNGTTMSFYLDNTLIGTDTVTQYSGPNTVSFGGNNQASNGNFFSVSNFFISSSSAITTTVMGNMITYSGGAALQAYANMETPKLSFNNAFNNLTETRGALVDLRFNEGSGSPQNYGTTTGINLAVTGDAVTYSQLSRNTKAYKITNTNAKISSVVTYPSGTFSTNNTQTLIAYAKVDSGTEPAVINVLALANHFGGPYGSGLGLYMLGSGAIRARIRDDAGANTVNSAGTYADSQYHLYVATTDGSTLKLYIDGKLEGSTSTTKLVTDSGLLMIGGEGDTFNIWDESKSTYIDEVSVYNYAFSAAQVFDHFQSLSQDMGWTAAALMVQPTASLGYGPIINPGVGYATALLADPTQQDTINNLAIPLTATGLLQNPNYAATKNFNYSATPMTATAAEEDSGASAGGNIVSGHMDALAYFAPAYARIPGRWNADPATVSALMVQPTIFTTLGALIKPQSLNAKAQLPLPPAYYTITDDIWYQRLLDVDYQSARYGGIITFFNTSSNIYLNGGYGGWNAFSNRNPLNANYGYNLYDAPLPVATAGYFDPENRKALNLRNIALEQGDYETYSGGWTMEAMIQTTKKNQFIAAGIYRGDTSSSVSRNYRTGIRLKDGKIAITDVKDSTLGFFKSNDSLAITGFKDIADGEWHHIIIQYRPDGVDQYEARTQIFIDGKLDVQRYGARVYFPGQIGYNSNDVNVYSDFNISAISTNKGSFVLEREININYLAAFGITPIEAPAAIASATLTPNNKGRGNRGRALMLYFWPTFKADEPRYLPYQRFMAGGVGIGFTDNDQGTYGDNPDTFYPVATQLGKGANQFYDWDIWPVPVTYYPGGDQFVGDTHPILKDGIFKSGTTKGTVYINPVTDNERYLNLQEDLKDLSQFDMICFRNYPDESNERDGYGTTAKGVADPYFNILDKDLFEEFLVSLRDAVDSGISLLITNPQLAVDMGFIDTYHQVDSLNGFGNSGGSDPYVPIKLNDPLGTGTPKLNIEYVTSLTDEGRTNSYEDYYRNNYHQVVNTIPGLTDDPAYIWKDSVLYTPDGLNYGELGRIWSHIEYNPGLQPGDKFLIACMFGANAYYATPINAIKAGKVITKFADTYMHGAIERVNPYRNYATTIAVEPGTVVAGKQIGAKVFISFTDNVGNQQGLPTTSSSGYPIEQALVELKSNYWIDYAYSTGSITTSDRDTYRAATNNLDNQYPNGGPIYEAEKYWTLNGQNILAKADWYGDNNSVGTDTAESVKSGKKVAKTRAGMKRKNTVSTSTMPAYTIVSSWTYPNIGVPTPSINTRALWWLSERLEYAGGLPQRPLAIEADAFMPQPQVSGYKIASVNAQAGLASATIVETSLRSGTLSINSAPLPMLATVGLVPLGLNIIAGVATASAKITTNFSTSTSKDDDIVLYVIHEDPILYIREDAIK